MEKVLKKLLLVMMAVLMAGSFAACSDDDGPVDDADRIVGVYKGTLNIVGAPDSEAEVAYVTLTKKSSNSVSCKIESEGWGVDMQPVNLAITISSNVINLKSETSKAISGQIISGNLQLTYETASGYVFQFLGKKS